MHLTVGGACAGGTGEERPELTAAAVRSMPRVLHKWRPKAVGGARAEQRKSAAGFDSRAGVGVVRKKQKISGGRPAYCIRMAFPFGWRAAKRSDMLARGSDSWNQAWLGLSD